MQAVGKLLPLSLPNNGRPNDDRRWRERLTTTVRDHHQQCRLLTRALPQPDNVQSAKGYRGKLEAPSLLPPLARTFPAKEEGRDNRPIKMQMVLLTVALCARFSARDQRGSTFQLTYAVIQYLSAVI